MTKKSALALALASAAGMMFAVSASAAPLPTTVSASSADYSGDLSFLNDGDIPPLRQAYFVNSVYNFGVTTFTFDFGGLVTITDLLASVDNNDDYTIDFFNGATYVISFSISKELGPVTPEEGGMDTFASFAGVDITQLGTSTLFQADRAVIFASGGDGLYGVGEVQFFDNSGAVPEPASWALMLGGFGLLGAAMRHSRGVAAVRFA